VGRDIVASGNSTILNGIVGRNVKNEGSKLRLKDHAAIGGNLSYTSYNKAKEDKGSKVAGKVSQTKPSKSNNKGIVNKYSIGFYLFVLFGLGLITLALAFFFPQLMRRTSGHIKDEFTKTLVVGLAASFLVPMISIGLVLTVVGIPLVFFVLIAWLFGALLSGPIAAYYVGQMILRGRSNPLAIASVGTLVLVTAYYLPIAGILVLMLAYWLGFGALLLAIKPYVRPQTEAKPAKTNKPAKAKKK
jgi:hypothetical protein